MVSLGVPIVDGGNRLNTRFNLPTSNNEVPAKHTHANANTHMHATKIHSIALLFLKISHLIYLLSGSTYAKSYEEMEI